MQQGKCPDTHLYSYKFFNGISKNYSMQDGKSAKAVLPSGRNGQVFLWKNSLVYVLRLPSNKT